MQDKELLKLWKAQDQKMNEVLSINRQVVYHLTKNKLDKTIGQMKHPKWLLLFIGIPYTLLLYFITFIAYLGNGLFVMIGFGTIALIMSIIVVIYIYHLYLIDQIRNNDEILFVQERLSRLKISSFNCARASVLQLPFWSICWMSLNALQSSPLLYGGINLLVFLGLAYLSYWLYKSLNLENKESKVSRFFLSGSEWEPIIKSSELLDQLKGYI